MHADSVKFMNAWLQNPQVCIIFIKCGAGIEAIIVTLGCASWAICKTDVIWICRRVPRPKVYNHHATMPISMKLEL